MADEWSDIMNLDHFGPSAIRRPDDAPSPSECLAGACLSDWVSTRTSPEANRGSLWHPSGRNRPQSICAESQISCKGKLFCYDIFEDRPEIGETYDFLFLFDVLEHIEDQLGFLTERLISCVPEDGLPSTFLTRQELFLRLRCSGWPCSSDSLESLSEVVATAGLNERDDDLLGLSTRAAFVGAKNNAQGAPEELRSFRPLQSQERFDQPCAHFACGFGADSEQDATEPA